MAQIIRRPFRSFNGIDWDTHYFETEASQVKTANGSDVEKSLAANANQNMYSQALINGNFDIWQRYILATNPLNNAILADRWRIEFLAAGATFPTLTHSRNPITNEELLGSKYYYRVSSSDAGSGYTSTSYYALRQAIENGAMMLCGTNKKITVSFYARCSAANKRLGVALAQSYGTGGSPTGTEAVQGDVITLTSSWKKYSITMDTKTLVGKTFGTNNDDSLMLYFFMQWNSNIASYYLKGASAEAFANCNIDITQVQVNAGDTALPFQPKSFNDELLACMRYYEKSYDYGYFPGSLSAGAFSSSVMPVATNNNTPLQVGSPIPFKVPKRVAPYVALYNADNGAVGSWYVGSNSALPVIAKPISTTQFQLANNSGSAVTPSGYGCYGHWTADAEI